MSNNILITGGAKRIGAKICEIIANFPYKKNIIIHYYRSHEEAFLLKESLVNENTDIFLFQADLTKIDGIKLLSQFIEENFDHLDILINNASIFQKDTFSNQKNDSRFMNYSNMHLTAPFFLSKFLINSQSNRKIIINMLDERRSDNEKIQNYGEYFYYSLTKHMMFVMHQYLQKEFEKSQNIKIYGLIMGLVLPNSTDIEYFKKNHIDQKNIDEKLYKISQILKNIFDDDIEVKDFYI